MSGLDGREHADFAVKTYIFADGQEIFIDQVGEFYNVISATHSDFAIAIDGGPLNDSKKGAKRRVFRDNPFKQLRVKNDDGAAANTIQIAIGFGDYSDAEVEIGGGINVLGAVSNTTAADDSIAGNATELVLAANADRREAWITNLAGNANNMRVGDSNAGAARGPQIAPGQTAVIPTAGAVYVHNEGAGAEFVGLLEVIN